VIKGEWTRGCESAHCVEVLRLENSVKMRDSKDPGGPWLTFSPDEWADFIDAAREGKFDL
jgi:hypothetical protein